MQTVVVVLLRRVLVSYQQRLETQLKDSKDNLAKESVSQGVPPQ